MGVSVVETSEYKSAYILNMSHANGSLIYLNEQQCNNNAQTKQNISKTEISLATKEIPYKMYASVDVCIIFYVLHKG